ncbi:molybdopterin molybdotransferase MoeA [Amnibacterium sp. CER49]|uniref:molybdopterin molybdotransferase MoeA n=1 Tax=Amnibacterium sp. CER49 TaxID=3039161 RepID=UPI00244B019B|nr:molybdopterin molybdotransferase MoeA [Amnibacterium sp. CER49]MDH2445497.1 molybdopterin molybdotransferase MoeA [Amnibacterium sp. CER49]
MTAIGWDAARETAASLEPLPPRPLALRDALGGVPADDVLAPAPVPHYDSSAMDGWAVTGQPPWRLGDTAVPVVTGGLVPAAADGVVPLERGTVDGEVLDGRAPRPGAHVRRAGEEAPAGSVLAAAGERLGPVALAVLAIAGLDEVVVRPAPRVAVLLTGDEVVTAGRPAPGRVRDAFDPLVPLAVAGLGGLPVGPVRLGDDPGAIAAAIREADADVVVTVGGTGRSGADRLREALAACAATTAFDGVAMRPGHPTLLARVGGRPLLGLPGNPLAAVAALLSFLPPVLAGLRAEPLPRLVRERAAVDLPAASGTAIVPVRRTRDGLTTVPAARPNMLRGLAEADVLAVVPPGGQIALGRVRVLELPWR